MRKTSAVLATLSLAVLALTGCTAAPTFDGASCDRTGEAASLRDAVTVEGEVGSKPDVGVFSPLALEETTSTDLVAGDGRVVENSQQALVLEMSLYSGDTGEPFYQTTYDPEQGQISNIAYWAGQIPGLGDVLTCVSAGSRVLAAMTPDDFGAQSLAGFGLEADDNVVFVIDVVDVYRAKAEGALKFNDARGMPTVVRAPDGTPGVIVPDSDAPDEQVVQTLIEGDGDDVRADQVPLVNLTAVDWNDKTVINSSWGQGPLTNLASTAPTVAEALIGTPVGSQVLVVTPGADGAGAVAYVVDILGAITVPPQ